ncbi:DUF883 domain-containing protein [uncultured Sulfitobacter sp.]|uniref:DUF883 family protein n=1 Tax=uncultured Sulfitobacter sp. TaxID=191468 RepID=UPI0026217EB9|nr:DUF883 domain-containing protein [uncultured Sulfitobacter sp.]
MAKAGTSSLSDKKDVTVEDLSVQIEILKDDLASLTNSISEYGSAKTHQATDAARAKATELRTAGRDRAAASYEQAEDFVRTQPATALGIAAGLGFLMGIFSTSRR